MPHVPSVRVWHIWFPSQQPAGQLAALQAPPVQTPPEQVCAGPHAGPIPQRQLPAVEQLFAFVGSHGAHV